jgi:hypothetical protein
VEVAGVVVGSAALVVGDPRRPTSVLQLTTTHTYVSVGQVSAHPFTVTVTAETGSGLPLAGQAVQLTWTVVEPPSASL